MYNYYFTNRVENGINILNGRGVNLNLNDCKSKLDFINDLARVYSVDTDIELTTLDYDNLYSIFYLLCNKDFTKSRFRERQHKASQMLEEVKQNKEHLFTVLVQINKAS